MRVLMTQISVTKLSEPLSGDKKICVMQLSMSLLVTQICVRKASQGIPDGHNSDRCDKTHRSNLSNLSNLSDIFDKSDLSDLYELSNLPDLSNVLLEDTHATRPGDTYLC